ncbi:unnamed protein product [Prunus armeniaca]
MVEKRLHRTYNYVYLPLTLALTLPVSTASVERAFSTMNIVKGPLRNRMGDQWLSASFLRLTPGRKFPESATGAKYTKRDQNHKFWDGSLIHMSN